MTSELPEMVTISNSNPSISNPIVTNQFANPSPRQYKLMTTTNASPKGFFPFPPPALAHSNQPSPVSVSNHPSTVSPVPITTWVSLEHWAAAHKFSVRRISVSPAVVYVIISGNNVVNLTIGSREAAYNGVQFNLGFAPEMIDGGICVYGLDLQKNIESLLLNPPLRFSGKNRVIVIDPGHGGSNVGTHSVLNGRLEKEFTLDWAKRIKTLLETNGWTVFLTRDSDVYMTNASRVVFA